MKPRYRRIAKWVGYPLFYIFCLGVFGYLTFPYDQLKGRLIAEFDRSQRKSKNRRSGGEPMRLEIEKIEGHWVTGIQITGARLTIPPTKKKKKRGYQSPSGLGAGGSKKDAPEKAAVIVIERAAARLQVMPLLLGNVRINFNAEAFGGEIEGTVPVGGGEVDVAFSGIALAEVEPLQALLEGVPLQGVGSGSLHLEPKGGKFARADGKLTVTLEGVKLGKAQKGEDGKVVDVVEMQGVQLPSVRVGQISIEATAKDGVLEIDDLSSRGPDFEFLGEGKVRLHERWNRSTADMYLKFKFSDAYRTKSDAASSLLGKPGDKFAPAIEIAPRSPFKRAKTEDGYYQFHVHKTLANLDFTPASSKSGAGKKSKSKRSFGSNRFGGKKAKPKAKKTDRKDDAEAEGGAKD